VSPDVPLVMDGVVAVVPRNLGQHVLIALGENRTRTPPLGLRVNGS
jgi:hypothetical protein